MTATKEEIGVRVDALAQAHTGDELSRHKSARVRASVPRTAVAVLDDGARRLVLSLTRDRDRSVRDAAVSALVELGPEAAKPIVPDLRRRLHADEASERIAAMAALARLGDRRGSR